MRTALLTLIAALAAGATGGFPIPSAQASLLPQIEEARRLDASRDSGTSALTEHYVEVSEGIFVAVRGAKERRQVRFARWVEGLDGDRRRVYEAEGFPRHRLRENDGGARTEQWTYPDAGRVYIFRGNDLIDTRRF